ncbi:hypothetical protein A0H81_09997 [Grifola frondosa]|uniref:Uncharacterized protein n=1 Tax=Grifola frondosa TaxID=5627 RepID=A0A1C7LZV6_GRIFR|nr:hypothetical protein A0H81_09997 [Grifola frondosa]
MRRIAAVFSSRRSDRSDSASSVASPKPPPDPAPKQPHPTSRPSFLRSISRKPKTSRNPVNNLNTSDNTPSSSSSSSGAPTTPDDDGATLPPHKSWMHWSSGHHHPPDSPPDSSHVPQPPPKDHASLPVHPPPVPSKSPRHDTDDETSSESSSDAEFSVPVHHGMMLSPAAFVRSLTINGLLPPFAPSPLLHIPGSPLYPRSSNLHCSLFPQESLESSMHKSRLLRHLDRGDLSPAELLSISAFKSRRTPSTKRPSLFLDDDAVTGTQIVGTHSQGLRKWADRPCFEDRVVVYMPEDRPGSHDITYSRVVSASGFGVAALEFSDTLELLAGLYDQDFEPEPEAETELFDFLQVDMYAPNMTPPLSLTPSSASNASSGPPSPASISSPLAVTPTNSKAAPAPVPVASQPRSPHIYKASPSPLRIEQSAVSSSPRATSALSVPSAAQSPTAPSASVRSPAPPILKSALKPGVRFAEEEKEDQIPLGYVMRIKQKREEKARFLKAERDRRVHEDERRRHEEEKRKWEQERVQWELERRAAEDERKKRMYADEVANARSRRESQRFPAVTGGGLATGEWDRERERKERDMAKYTRPVYDPAAHLPRQGSDSSIALASGARTGSRSPPVESRPASVHGSASGSVRASSSRPPSMNVAALTPSSSATDVRQRDRRESRVSGSGSGSRRGSMIGETGSHRGRGEPSAPPLSSLFNTPPMPPLPMPMPMGVPMMMPPMPMYGMDMPLLPPAPPFMLQQFGYRPPQQHQQQMSQQQRSQSSSPTLGRQGLPRSGSADRMSRPHSGSVGTAASPSPSRSPHEAKPHQHHRRSSADVDMQRRPPQTERSLSDDRHSSSSARVRPTPVHSASLPPQPPTVLRQPRSSWVYPQSGFENSLRYGTVFFRLARTVRAQLVL